MDIQKVTVLGTTPIEHPNEIQRVDKLKAVRAIGELDRTDQLQNKKKSEELEKTESSKLDKMEYGYNDLTGDLVIKITKSDGTIGQYPTESMMKLKALLKEEFLQMRDEHY